MSSFSTVDGSVLWGENLVNEGSAVFATATSCQEVNGSEVGNLKSPIRKDKASFFEFNAGTSSVQISFKLNSGSTVPTAVALIDTTFTPNSSGGRDWVRLENSSSQGWNLYPYESFNGVNRYYLSTAGVTARDTWYLIVGSDSSGTYSENGFMSIGGVYLADSYSVVDLESNTTVSSANTSRTSVSAYGEAYSQDYHSFNQIKLSTVPMTRSECVDFSDSVADLGSSRTILDLYGWEAQSNGYATGGWTSEDSFSTFYGTLGADGARVSVGSQSISKASASFIEDGRGKRG